MIMNGYFDVVAAALCTRVLCMGKVHAGPNALLDLQPLNWLAMAIIPLPSLAR